MDLNFLYRDQWDRLTLPPLGEWVPAIRRTSIVVHHTVTVDRDPTPNVWESIEECAKHMRRLQTIRAQDLGADVPYSFVAFLMADGTVTLAHGRGFSRSGAHSPGRNSTGFGIAFAGNFEAADAEERERLAHALAALGSYFGRLASGTLPVFPKLGTDRPGDGRHAWAHRDFKATACPGQALYDLLEHFRLEG